MRKVYAIFLSLIVFKFCYSQHAPQALNYQAVARTSKGLIIPAQTVSVRFSILDGSVNGPVVYQETQTATTNNFGLFTLAIGKGVALNGTFAGINWGSGDKFLKIELGPSNNGVYDLQGTTQLLSVPYALYAEKTKLTAADSTITITADNSIKGNYQGGNAIKIQGNTISSNYNSGNGIKINGNTISSTDTNYWRADANGIHYTDESGTGNVGIGMDAVPNTNLSLIQKNLNGGGSCVLDMNSNDTWQTVFRFRNSTANQEYQLNLGGSTNRDMAPGTLGIFNNNSLNWVWNTDAATSNLAIGSYNTKAQVPKSRLTVFNGDVNINDIGNGIIMKSPDGQCWKVTVSNTGALISTSIPCL